MIRPATIRTRSVGSAGGSAGSRLAMSSIGWVATRSSRWLTKYRYAVALDTPAWAAAASTVGVVPAASSVRAASIIAARVRAFWPVRPWAGGEIDLLMMSTIVS